MKKMISNLLVVVIISLAGVVWADEMLFDKVKTIVDKTEPRAGVFFNRKSKDIQAITEAKIFSTDIKGYEIDSTLGYGIDKTVLYGLETDILANLSKIPGVSITIPWLKIHTGFHVGWSIEDGQIAYGPSVNASVKW